LSPADISHWSSQWSTMMNRSNRMTFDDIFSAEKQKATKTRKRPAYREDKLQMNCKYWFDCQYPQYKLLMHHSPNEGLLMRHDRDGAKRKAMGMRAGFPDFIFLLPNKEYPYLALELKVGKNTQSEHQKEYQQAVEQAGGKYVVIYTLEEFISSVNEYINNK
jgi:hypothetical protein